jgi:hypothetical protein
VIMTKCLIFLAILAISRTSPIENSSNLVSLFTGVFEHVEEVEMKRLDISCVWEKLKLKPNEAIKTAVIADIEEFKSKSARNRKIVTAAQKAAYLCNKEEKPSNHFRSLIVVGMLFYKPESLECTKLELRKIDPNSKLLEGFTTTKTYKECSKITKERDKNSSNSLSSEENAESEAAELEIQSCTSELFDDDLENKRIQLMATILASSFEGKENEVTEAANRLEKMINEKIEKKLECIMMDLGVE